MRMEQANAIAMTEILQIIGHTAVKKEGKDHWFYSPLINDNMSLFHVDAEINFWRDFGARKMGHAVDFVVAYLEMQGEDHTPADAVRWLENMLPCTLGSHEFCKDDPSYPNQNFIIDKMQPLKEGPYNKYLHFRGIPVHLAKAYLKDARVTNYTNGKSFDALALVNENGGYHLVNRRFKGGVAPAGVTVLRGSVILPPEVHVFKNFMDFLAVLTQQGKSGFEGDTIILNSLSNLSNAFPYIRGYTYEKLYLWLDNTPESQKASEILDAFCAKQPKKITCKTMNHIYSGFRDVSSWHRYSLGLKP